MNTLLAIILSGSIIIWKTEPPRQPHISLFENDKPAMTIQQKHEWTVEERQKNRKERRRKK